MMTPVQLTSAAPTIGFKRAAVRAFGAECVEPVAALASIEAHMEELVREAELAEALKREVKV